jgi:hypothetical protein
MFIFRFCDRGFGFGMMLRSGPGCSTLSPRGKVVGEPGDRDNKAYFLIKSKKDLAGMDLTIQIPDDIAAALKAQAQAQGVTAARYASRMIEKNLAPAVEPESSSKPFETGYGMWAKYGPAPSIEEIDENRREMFRNFAQDPG